MNTFLGVELSYESVCLLSNYTFWKSLYSTTYTDILNEYKIFKVKVIIFYFIFFKTRLLYIFFIFILYLPKYTFQRYIYKI